MMNKLFQHIGLFSFGIYFVFACVFYQERTLFLDNPFQIFLMIVEGDIAVNAHRWPAVIVRIIPYLFIQLEAPIKVVLLSFSLSYWLFHFVIFYTIRYRLKERSFALLQLATVTLPVAHSFFWCNSEQNLAISLLVLTLALFKQRKYIWTGVLCFVLLWLHPLIFLPFGFVMSLYTVDAFLKKEKPHRAWVPIIFGLAFTVMYVIKSVFIKNWYDNIKSTNFKENLLSYDFNVLNILDPFVFQNHFLFTLITLFSLFLLLYQRAFIKAGLWSIFVFLYLVILDISNSSNTSYVFYDEVNYLIIFFGAAFIVTDFIKSCSPVIRKVLFVNATIFVIFNWCVTSGFYTERIGLFKSFVGHHDREVYKYENNSDLFEDLIVMPWASAYESLVISELVGESSTTLITRDVKKYKLSSSESLFFAEFKTYDLEVINRSYFDLAQIPYYQEIEIK